MTLELLAELMGVSIDSARKLVAVMPRKSTEDEALAAIKALWLTESGGPVAEWLAAHGGAVCHIAERLIAIREPSAAEG
ncbi:MAG TPA: hypothetical protein VKQ27_05500 [Acetobacteraceae bacterium]|nr:hypothetical protein [Acetobacteraceae bacterium]